MRRILLASAFTLISVSVIAQETTDPAAILRRAALFGQFSSLEVDLTMEIHERRGTKDRGLVAYVERDGENAQALVQIVSPAFLNSMKFLSTTDGADTSQWLATSRGVRRVATNSRNDQLFDSDFTVEDLSDYDPEDFDLTIIGSEQINGSDCYVLEAVPLDIETDYARRVMYVDKTTGLLVLAEFLNGDGGVVRKFELLEHMDLDGVAFPKVAKMTTVSAGTHTILTIDDAQIGHDIPDRIFNRGNL
jgi:hypothetical protein